MLTIIDGTRVLSKSFSIVLHAGAGESYRGGTDAAQEYLRTLAINAKTQLSSGASALGVAVHVTASLEDCPYFNAGKGASLNIEGKHEVPL